MDLGDNRRDGYAMLCFLQTHASFQDPGHTYFKLWLSTQELACS